MQTLPLGPTFFIRRKTRSPLPQQVSSMSDGLEIGFLPQKVKCFLCHLYPKKNNGSPEAILKICWT
jgi:hypothetical protein